MDAPPADSLCVLIIEDCPDTAESLACLVRLWGHEPHVAHRGPEGLHLAAMCPPDVVLLDIGLPGMDGWEVARRLRASDGPERSALIIAFTGFGREEDRHRSEDSGCDVHLTKPAPPEQIEHLLNDRRPVARVT